jgi:hypothetical protein
MLQPVSHQAVVDELLAKVAVEAAKVVRTSDSLSLTIGPPANHAAWPLERRGQAEEDALAGPVRWRLAVWRALSQASCPFPGLEARTGPRMILGHSIRCRRAP